MSRLPGVVTWTSVVLGSVLRRSRLANRGGSGVAAAWPAGTVTSKHAVAKRKASLDNAPLSATFAQFPGHEHAVRVVNIVAEGAAALKTERGIESAGRGEVRLRPRFQ